MLFKRKKKTDDTQLHIESIPDESTKGFNVVEICEQMVDAARELEDNRTEYALVTNYLTDIERMENMSETDKKTMNDAAANILTLEKTRSDFLKTKNRIEVKESNRLTCNNIPGDNDHSRYNLINEMIISDTLSDETTLKSNIDEYKRLDAATKQLFKLI